MIILVACVYINIMMIILDLHNLHNHVNCEHSINSV